MLFQLIKTCPTHSRQAETLQTRGIVHLLILSLIAVLMSGHLPITEVCRTGNLPISQENDFRSSIADNPSLDTPLVVWDSVFAEGAHELVHERRVHRVAPVTLIRISAPQSTRQSSGRCSPADDATPPANRRRIAD